MSFNFLQNKNKKLFLNKKMKHFMCWTFFLLFSLSMVNSKPFSFEEEDEETCELGNCSSREEVYSIKPSRKQLCDFCYIVMPLIRVLLEKNKTEHATSIVDFICHEFRLTDPVVCDLAIKSYKMSVMSIARDSKLASADICSVGLGCAPSKNPLLEWNITLPNVPKPPLRPLTPPNPNAPKLRILQLSDIHIDFEYQPGSIAECNQPLCCRNSSTKNHKIEATAAGYWGDYRSCDIPLWTVENMFKHLSENEEFDFIYWTGDLPPHNVWNQTKSDQLNAIEVLTELFLKYFPNKAIFPTLGNHEAQPCNLFPTPYVKEDSIDWLYSALAKEWTKTGLPNYLSANITNGAFYTIKLFEKLRLISLNTNYCPRENFWLLINATDPLDQLKWLAEVLQESENHNEKVHIIGHIHPSNCLQSWSANYYKIISRYEAVIVAQIFGHSHRDEISIFYDLQNLTRPVSISYLGPSVTTTPYLNPSYRIYTIDGEYEKSSFQIIDHHTFFLNLTRANAGNAPKWEKEYSAKEAYDLENLFPESWNGLVNKMLNEPFGEMANKYFQFYSKLSDAYPECDLKCRKNILCGIKQARSDNFVAC